MIAFEDHGSQVVLIYESEAGPIDWLDKKLSSNGSATLSRVFTVQSAQLFNLGEDGEDTDVRAFVIGGVADGYRTIHKDVIGLKQDLQIADSISLTKSLFVAERNISIFGRIDDLIEEPIVVGGPRDDAIPEDEFRQLLRTFPTSTEVRYYAATRIVRILREYLDTMSDAERRLASYIQRRDGNRADEAGAPLGRIAVANELGACA